MNKLVKQIILVLALILLYQLCSLEKQKQKNTLESWESYMKKYPDKNTSATHKVYDELLYEQALASKKNPDVLGEIYKKCKTTDGAAKVFALWDKSSFEKASKEDFYSDYQNYLKEFPNGAYVEKAKERIDWLRSQRAVFVVEFPKEVEQRESPYINVSSPFWGWDTVFKEVGGKIGYKVKGEGYILDPRGGRWVTQWSNTIPREEVKVPAGGSGKDSYWCSSSSHNLCNGYAIFTWTGEDAGGHKISIDVKVHLKHTGCPGPKKDK